MKKVVSFFSTLFLFVQTNYGLELEGQKYLQITQAVDKYINKAKLETDTAQDILITFIRKRLEFLGKQRGTYWPLNARFGQTVNEKILHDYQALITQQTKAIVAQTCKGECYPQNRKCIEKSVELACHRAVYKFFGLIPAKL